MCVILVIISVHEYIIIDPITTGNILLCDLDVSKDYYYACRTEVIFLPDFLAIPKLLLQNYWTILEDMSS